MLWLVTQHLAVVAALILIVSAVCRHPRVGPAARHILWLTVLFKLVIPPIVMWPGAIQDLWPSTILPAPSTNVEVAKGDIVATVAANNIREEMIVAMAPSSAADLPQPPHVPTAAPAFGSALPASDHSSSKASWFVHLPWIGWAVGSIATLFWSFVQMVRIQRRLAQSATAPRWLQDLVVELSRELEITPPRLVVSHNFKSPFVWCFGQLRLIWPAAMTTSKQDESVRCMLIHELAHIRRRDHWTIWLELATRFIWWWNPLFWLSRRELRENAEMACDAWVVRLFPEQRRLYADSLLDICRQTPSIVPMAVNAGASSKRAFKRRLMMIMSNKSVTRTGWSWCLATTFLLVSVPGFSWGDPSISNQVDDTKPKNDTTPADSSATKEESPPKVPRPVVVDQADKRPTKPAVNAEGMLAEILKKVEGNYYGNIDKQALVEAAAAAMLKELDENAEYLSRDSLKQFYRNLDSTVGVGIILAIEDDDVVIRGTWPGTPGAKAGLRPGDVIAEIDNERVSLDAEPNKLTTVVRRLRGAPGSAVTLGIQRGQAEELRQVRVIREQVRVPTVHGYHRDADGQWEYLVDKERQIGFLHILHFAKGTSAEANAVIHRLKQDGLKGLVIDLRDCPGGMLNESVSLAASFLKTGQEIVSVTGRGDERRNQVYQAEVMGEFRDLPLAILVNQYTASAAEIFASSLQDHQRAIVIGDRTFGRGIVQSIVPLRSGGGALKLATAKYVRPNGNNMQRHEDSKETDDWGVRPNKGYKIKFTEEELEKFHQDRSTRENLAQARTLEITFDDRQLGKALDYLK